MEIAGLIITHSTAASMGITCSLAIVAIIRTGRAITNKSFVTVMVLLTAATALLSLADNPKSAQFWVMAPGALALSYVALYKAVAGAFVEYHDPCEPSIVDHAMRTSEPARFHACAAVSGVRCPTE